MPETHSVQLRPSGHRFSVNPGETLLDAALRQGMRLPYGCRSGHCGSCRATLVSGRIDYAGAPTSALTEAEQARGEILCCQARAAGPLVLQLREVVTAADLEIKTLPVRIARLQRLAPDVTGLWLQLPRSERLQFFAGQHLDILLKDGRRRAYSLANAPEEDEHLELHVRHYPGGAFSDQLFGALAERSLLRIRGPYGSFQLREEGTAPVLLAAGGTGFAPIKSILEHARARGLRRRFHLYRGARRPAGLYLDERVRQWLEEGLVRAYAPVVSEPAKEDGWRGRTGLLHQAVAADFPDLSGWEIYACGPPPMIEALRGEALARGLEPGRFHCDAFELAADPDG